MTVTETSPGARRTDLLLAQARGIVDALLRRSFQQLPPAMRLVCGYQLGWWEADGRPASGASGKALRPALALAAAEAAGGHRSAAVPAGAVAELVHNFSLLHDDVLDRDETRRHRATAWKVYGTADAILAGDAMLALASQLLATGEYGFERHPRALGEALRRMGRCVTELCEAQHLDCEFETRTDVELAECLGMAEGKTGALLGLSCALGALAAGAPDGVVRAMDAFGRRLGMVFQLTDDLLGIWGDPAVTGKPVGADLLVRKKSLPVVAALHEPGPAGRELRARYASAEPLDQAGLTRTTELVELAGGRAWAVEQARHYTVSALALLDHGLPATADTAALRDLAASIAGRTL
ncbi:polyprenyl synthetase [Kitasatospora sp. MMS16-BH015]|uniref:polyprenyl synthetase family protein n=1 Tax=Kitasatospora sp. MMS16-BH015 TaxID=2018025 RepID=UPI000CA3D903|nr:polyprenyl synthetase family protein [Kitasatospora sp. MMS16-BH015]AUG75642.1 polyprenyl synthetase [Kitasatospora sp. MMS16-BH015]